MESDGLTGRQCPENRKRRDARGEGTVSKPFLYAIMEPDGTPYMSEDCVCQDRIPLDDQVICLNGDLEDAGAKGRYKVVALYRIQRQTETPPAARNRRKVNG
jgi:hypothetical protein